MAEPSSDARYDPLEDAEAVELGNATPMNDNATSRASSRSRGEVPILAFWTIASTISLVTSKYLLVDRVYHFPKHLVLWQIICTAIVYIWNSARDSKLPFRKGISQAFSNFYPQESWVHVAPAAIPLAIAYPMYMHAIWHIPNLPTIVMLCSISYLFQGITLKVVKYPVNQANFAVRHVILALASFFILWDEYRLDAEGILFAIPASILAGISKGLYTKGRAEVTSGGDHAGRFLTATLTLTFAFTTVWTLFTEESYWAVMKIPPKGWLNWALNLTFSSLAITCGGTFVLPMTAIDNDVSFTGSIFTQVQAEVITNFCLTALVAIGSLFLKRRYYSSPVQVLAYFVALIPVAMARSTDQTAIKPSSALQQQSRPLTGVNTNGRGLGSTTHTRMPFFPTLFVLSLLGIFVAICTFLPTNDSVGFAYFQPFEKMLPRLDLEYRTKSKFDIVVAMYEEPLSEVVSMLNRLREIPLIKQRSPRVFIYLKDLEGNSTDIAKQTGAHKVIYLENKGRETETYLSHIIKTWDSLAEHTLFTQAEIHNPREFFPRVEDYYRKETGMLSLGFTGHVCDCNDCGDMWGWSEEPEILSDIYKTAYPKGECKEILLSYKGQFIVSARRIRGLHLTSYKKLRRQLIDPHSFSHQPEYLKGRKDNLSAPRFGYTLERMWNLLFQCSSMEVGWKCPSLLSGSRRGGGPGDCQCFDEVE